MSFEGRPPSGVLEIVQRDRILGVVVQPGQMQMAIRRDLAPARDQFVVDGVELIEIPGNDLALHRLFEPGPLKHRGLEQRGGDIGIVFEQFRWSVTAEAEVEAAVKRGIAAPPALGEDPPAGLRDPEAA